jgi:hypothetical protein
MITLVASKLKLPDLDLALLTPLTTTTLTAPASPSQLELLLRGLQRRLPAATSLLLSFTRKWLEFHALG